MNREELNSVLNTVAIYYGTTVDELRSDDMKKPLPEARRVFFYLTEGSNRELVGSIINRSVSSISVGLIKIKSEIKNHSEVRYRVNQIQEILKHKQNCNEEDQNNI